MIKLDDGKWKLKEVTNLVEFQMTRQNKILFNVI